MNRELNYTSMPDQELLGRLIGVRATTKLYSGSLTPLFTGDDRQQHQKCAIARELIKRWLGEEMKARCVLAAPTAVREYLQIHFAGREYESFVALWSDAQNKLIAAEELFRGTLTQTSVYAREIVKGALAHNAGAVIFSHNHPSGCSEPSRADEMLTSTLKQALALVDVRVLDHMIVAGPTILSFAERGLL